MNKFHSKYIQRGVDECWEWVANKDSHGYGCIKINNKTRGAHRVMYELVNQVALVHKEFVCHSCDNPACVNPAHLFIGTHTENMKDMVNKGRSYKPKGESNSNSKVTEEDVLTMREMYSTGNYTQAELCDRYPIKKSQMSNILRGDNWREL